MSTKIHGGHRVDLDTWNGNLFAFHAAARAACLDAYRELYLSRLVPLACLVADRLAHDDQYPRLRDDWDRDLGGASFAAIATEARVTPLQWATHYLEDCWTHVNRTQRRNPTYDLQVRLSYVADPDDARYAYLLVGTEHADAYYPALRALDGVEEFAYWNNTDRPEDVTDEQWDERAAIWGRVLPYSGDVASLSWEHPEPHGLVRTPKADGVALERYLPDAEARARALVRQIPLDPIDGAVDGDGVPNMGKVADAMIAHRDRHLPVVLAALPEVTIETLRTRPDPD